MSILIISANYLYASDTDCNPTINISDTLTLEKQQLREYVTLSASASLVTICNFTPGESYKIISSKAELYLNCIPKISLQTNDGLAHQASPELTIQATHECVDLLVTNNQCTSEYSAAFSVVCTSCPETNTKTKTMAGIETDDSYTPQELIEDIFIGGGCFDIVPGSIQPIGELDGIGAFSNGNSSIGIDNGIILATGPIGNASGPNTSNGTTGDLFDNSGEEDLADLGAGNIIRDAVGIEFEFIPTTDKIEFKYVFASEEYCEFAGSTFNDVFGFFISGPGINGGFSNNAENIALIPGTGNYVSINNLNHISNTAYYNNNHQLADAISCFLPHNPVAPATIEYDGFTTVLTAIANVVPCEVYRIKMTVADVGDYRLDSAVFLEANSFEAGGQAIVTSETPNSPNNLAFEGCTDAHFLFERSDLTDISEPLVINYITSPLSTALVGVDYNPLPDSITIPAGDTSFILPVIVIDDNLAEPNESIILDLANPCSCTAPFVEMLISDVTPMTATAQDVTICAQQSSATVLAPSISGGVQPYTYLWNTGEETASIATQPTHDSTYTLIINDVCGNTTSVDVTINLQDEVKATLTGSIEVCPEDPVAILQVDFLGDGPYDFNYSHDAVAQPPITNIMANPYTFSVSGAGTYQLTNITGAGCTGDVDGSAIISLTALTIDEAHSDVTCFNVDDGTIAVTASGGEEPYSFDWDNNETGANLNGLGGGDYELTLKDAKGCIYTETITIEEPEELTAVMNATPVTCFQASDGIANVVAGGGTIPYSYTWSNGLGGETISSLDGDVYRVRIQDENGCIKIDSILVEEPEELEISLEASNISCAGFTDGSLVSTVTGGNTPYNFSWSNDATTPNLSSVGAGDFILTVEDDKGCIKSQNASLSQPLPLAVETIKKDISCFGNQDGTISITANGGVAPYEYDWSNNQSIPNLTDLDRGNYILTLRDSNGCNLTESVEIIEPDELIITLDATDVTCYQAANGRASVVATGGIMPYEYTWNGLQEDESIENLDGGTYQVIVSDANACTKVDDIQVIEPDELKVEIDATDVSCHGFTDADLTTITTGGTAPYSYSWNTGPISPDLTDVGQGSYIVTVEDDKGCIKTETQLLTEPNPISVQKETTDVTCFDREDGTAQITVMGGTIPYTYEWSNGETSNDLSNLEEGAYLVTIKDLNGCVEIETVDIGIDANLPVAVAEPTIDITCAIPSVNLIGTGSSTGGLFDYTWSTDDGNIVDGINTLMPVVNKQGTYTLEVRNTETDCIITDNAFVQADTSLPVAYINTLSPLMITCSDPSVALDATGSLPFGNLSFNWESSNGNIMSGQNTPTPEVNADGNYILTVENLTNGCVDSKTITVDADTDLPRIDIATPDILSCKDTVITVDASASSTGANFGYRWQTNTGSILTGIATPTLNVNGPGEYFLSITNQTNGCQDSSSVMVMQNIEPPIVMINDPEEELDCNTPTMSLDAQGSSTGNNFTYAWVSFNGNIVSGDNTLSPSIDASGNYILEITNQINGCKADSDVEVSENTNRPSAADIIPTPPVCHGDKGTIAIVEITGGEGPYIYSYDGGENFYADSIALLESGSYDIVIQDLNGCEYAKPVTVPEVFEVKVDIEPEIIINLGEEIMLQAEPNIPFSTIDTIFWTPADSLSCSDCLTPLARPYETTKYTVTIINNKGCEASDDILLRVDKLRNIYVPNAFSPNDDDINDRFTIFSDGISIRAINQFNIFNRWGEQVFSAQNIPADDESYGWNGLFRGKRLSPQVLVYFAEIEFIDGVKVMVKGDVTIMN